MWNRHSRGEIQLPNVLFILLNHYFSRTSFLSIYILSEDDCLQFSYSSVYPIYYYMEAGRHRRLQSTKAPYHAMIKVDRSM